MTSHGERIRRESRDTKAGREGLASRYRYLSPHRIRPDCTPPVVLSISPWGRALPSHGFEPLSPPSHPIFRHLTYTHNATKNYALPPSHPPSSSVLPTHPVRPYPTLPPYTLRHSPSPKPSTSHPSPSITTPHHTTPIPTVPYGPVWCNTCDSVKPRPFRSRILDGRASSVHACVRAEAVRPGLGRQRGS